MPLRLFAAPLAVRHAAHVDCPGRAVGGDTHGVVEALRDRVRTAEVHRRPEGDQRELGVRAGAQEAVHRLVERPVAADRDEQVGPAAGRLLRKLDQVTGPF
jgi:hypothetical protein